MSAAVSIVTGLFTGAAAGMLTALRLAPFAELRRFFFAVNALIALLFLALAVVYRIPAPGRPGDQGIAAWAFGLTAAALVLVIAYITALYLPGNRPRWVLLGTASLAALGATALDGWRTAPGAGGPAWLRVAGALSGSALLGAVIVAMMLGHWYLVRWRLPVGHLIRFAKVLAGAVATRAVLLAAGLIVAGTVSAQGLTEFLRGVAVDRGFFFWQRVFFGILGPAVFSWMVHETARIKSTQSATGILYIAVIFVLYGELLARYLSVAGTGTL